jgi:hypothetical protein
MQKVAAVEAMPDLVVWCPLLDTSNAKRILLGIADEVCFQIKLALF